MANDALDGFDVSRVQGPDLQIKWNWRHPMSIGWVKHNLLNNSKTNVLGLLCFKLLAFGNKNMLWDIKSADFRQRKKKNLYLALTSELQG